MYDTDTLTTLHEPILLRQSSKGFTTTPLPNETLRSLFEAARWSPSSRNEQPWRFLLASKSDNPQEFEKLLSVLNESNKIWAVNAPALVAVAAKTTLSRDGSINRHAQYDVGGAVATLTIQAVSLGMQVHQMGGFNSAKLRDLYNVPNDFEPMAVLAIGYPDYSLQAQRERARKELSEFVFENQWGNSSSVNK